MTPKTLSILTPNAVWEVHHLTVWEFHLALVELYIVHTLGYNIAPWVIWFEPQGVEIWTFKTAIPWKGFLHFWNEKGICILSVLGITTFCFKHCLNPSRLTFNQFLTLLNWYSLPLHSHNSWISFGEFSGSASLLLRQPQRCSMGFRSGDCAGQPLSWIIAPLASSWPACRYA